MSGSLSTRHDVKNQTDDEAMNGSNYDSNLEHHSGIDKLVLIACALNIPLILISILGNTLILASIIRTPSIRSTQLIMLGSLAISDLLVGIIAQSFFITNEIRPNNHFVSNLSKMTGVMLCGVSLCTITAISVDRFMALHYHMRYDSLVTKPRVKCTVVLIWLTNFVLASFQLWNKRILNLSSAGVIVICLGISTFCYVNIYRIVRRHQLQIHAQQQALQSSSLGNNLNMARMRRSAINTFIFYVVLILCYFPIYVSLLFKGASSKNWKAEWSFGTTLVFMNSSINPFLYCWRLSELRTAVVKTARHIVCRQTDQ